MPPIELTTQVTFDGYIQLPDYYRNYYGRVVKLKVFLQEATEAVTLRRSLASELLDIGRRCATSPLLDNRTSEEILGYDHHEVPH